MNKNLSLSLEISADPSKLKAGLAISRREILSTYGELKKGVDDANKSLAEAKQRAEAMAKGIGQAGPPTKALASDFEKARAAVVAAKAAVEAKVLALQKARQAASENADAINKIAKAERDELPPKFRLPRVA